MTGLKNSIRHEVGRCAAATNVESVRRGIGAPRYQDETQNAIAYTKYWIVEV